MLIKPQKTRRKNELKHLKSHEFNTVSHCSGPPSTIPYEAKRDLKHRVEKCRPFPREPLVKSRGSNVSFCTYISLCCLVALSLQSYPRKGLAQLILQIATGFRCVWPVHCGLVNY